MELSRSAMPKPRHAEPLSSDNTSWFDAETDARLAGEAITRHGRRCSCTCRRLPTQRTGALTLIAGGAA